MLDEIVRSIAHNSYLFVFFMIFFEDFGMPVPGETVLIAAGILAGEGNSSIVLVLLSAVVGAILGDNIGYLIGFYGGSKLIGRYRKKPAFAKYYDKATEVFIKRGSWIIIIARFFEGLRQLNGIIAGLFKMPWKRFLVFNVAGAVLWAGTWCGIAYLLGRESERVLISAVKYKFIAVTLLLSAAAIAAFRRFVWKSKR